MVKYIMPIKFYIYGIAALLLVSAVGGTYFYVKHLQSENAVLTANNLKLEQSVDLQKETITSMETDAKKAGSQIVLINKEFRAARKENNLLRQKLAKHDIAYLAEKKPGLMTKVINNGTKDVGRCFEILSGSPLTEKELTATKKSQTNSSCPDIANPNYEAKQ